MLEASCGNSTATASWKSSVDPCNWWGVASTHEKRNAIVLALVSVWTSSDWGQEGRSQRGWSVSVTVWAFAQAGSSRLHAATPPCRALGCPATKILPTKLSGPSTGNFRSLRRLFTYATISHNCEVEYVSPKAGIGLVGIPW